MIIDQTFSGDDSLNIHTVQATNMLGIADFVGNVPQCMPLFVSNIR